MEQDKERIYKLCELLDSKEASKEIEEELKELLLGE